MRKVMLILAALSILPIVSAQEVQEASKYGWQKEAVVSLNLTQASFDNYKQGGENSRAWQARSTVKFVNDQENYVWSNSGKFEYGNLKSGDKPVQKSVDEIKLESVLTYKVGRLLNPYLSAIGETQFAPGYDYSQSPKVKISQFLDPGTIREAMGLGYKPSDLFQIRFGAAAKQTLSRRFTSITDKPETEKIEKLKNEIGAESVIDLNYKIGGATQLKSKVELFSNLKALNQIDVIWDSDLTTKITKYIAFNFNVKLLYDRNVSAKRQLKQVMGLGISYSLF